jgi:hypothetical protein
MLHLATPHAGLNCMLFVLSLPKQPGCSWWAFLTAQQVWNMDATKIKISQRYPHPVVTFEVRALVCMAQYVCGLQSVPNPSNAVCCAIDMASVPPALFCLQIPSETI